MDNKQKYAQRGREVATVASNLFDQVIAWRNVYWDRTYNTGGADALTNEDVAVTGVTAADVTGLITFADALETFLVANRAYLSQMRNDL
jgi:hypothetical protein